MAGKHSNNGPDLGYFVPSIGGAAPKGGAHSKVRLGVAGPPAARQSIATGPMKTKSQIEAEEAAAAEQAAMQQGWGGYDGYGAGAGAGAGYGAGAAAGWDGGYGYEMGPDDMAAYDYGYGQDAGYGAAYNQPYDGGYGASYGAPAAPYPQNTGYGYNDAYNGYTPAHGAPAAPGGNFAGRDYGYNPDFDYTGYDYNNGGYGFDPNPDDYYDDGFYYNEPWVNAGMAEIPEEEPKPSLVDRLFRRNKKEAPAEPWVMTADDRMNAEAWARGNTDDEIASYEMGIPLSALTMTYDPMMDADPDGSGVGTGSGAGVGLGAAAAGLAAGAAMGFAGRGKGGNVPTLANQGVQVQVPTAGMEKSLTRSTDAKYQRQVDKGTGGKLMSAMSSAVVRGKGKRGGGGISFSTDKEVVKALGGRLLTFVILIAVVIAAAGVGALVGYFVSLSNRLSLEDADAVEAVLHENEGSDPYYVLFAADLDSTDGSNDDLDAVLVARIDETNQKVTLVAMPGNIEVILSDFDYHPATMARDDGGNARLIVALEDLLGVEFAHYVQTDSKGIAAVVDALGGIQMTLEQEIDDPQAGYLYMPAGDYLLDGETALIVLRADNYHEGEATRGTNRCTFGKLLVEKLLGNGWLNFANVTDVIVGNVQTDYKAMEIIKLARTMKGITVDDVMSGVIPGDQETTGDVKIFTPDYAELKDVMELVRAGLSPTVDYQKGANVNPASVTVTVWNGSGVVGGAAMLGDILSQAGFDVQEITNAAAYAYTETFIIYDDEDNIEAAYAVQNALGQGRVLDGTWKYTFTTDILVVLGSEWK